MGCELPEQRHFPLHHNICPRKGLAYFQLCEDSVTMRTLTRNLVLDLPEDRNKINVCWCCPIYSLCYSNHSREVQMACGKTGDMRIECTGMVTICRDPVLPSFYLLRNIKHTFPPALTEGNGFEKLTFCHLLLCCCFSFYCPNLCLCFLSSFLHFSFSFSLKLILKINKYRSASSASQQSWSITESTGPKTGSWLWLDVPLWEITSQLMPHLCFQSMKGYLPHPLLSILVWPLPSFCP